MKRGPSNELTLCLRALVLAAVALLAACGGNKYSNGPDPQPSPTTSTATIYPQAPSVPVGSTIDFIASAPGEPAATFTWSVTGGGTIDSSTGVYTAGASAANAVVTAKSGSFSGSVTVAVTSAPLDGVTMSPAALFVEAGNTVPVSATVGGAAASVTEWDVNGAPNGDTLHGTIDNFGNYTAPLTPPPGGTTTITAKTTVGAGNTVVTVVFSDASLEGPYAFSYIGSDTKGFVNFAGSFTASGKAISATNKTNIGGLTEDLVAADIPAKTITQGTGTYAVQPDGTTQATLSDGTTWEFVLTGNTPARAGQPAQQALLIRFDKFASTSGTIDQQTAAAVNLPMPLGPYTFALTGKGDFKSIFEAAGKFQSSGLVGTAGVLTPGVWDVNDAGVVSTDDTTLSGSFSTDTSNSGTGRGTLQLTTARPFGKQTTYVFAFYVVDETHLKLVEIDGTTFSAGDVFDAPNTNGSFSAASLTKGNYAFTTSGATSAGPYSQGGVFVSNGSGDISDGEMDVNAGAGSINLANQVTETTYTVDPALGRIQFSLTAGAGAKTIGTWNYAGYQTSSGALVMVETDSVNILTIVGGTAFQQSSTNGLASAYAADFTGIRGSVEEDVAGQFIVTNSSISTGSLNSNIVGSGLTTGAPVTEALVIAPNTAGRGTATLYTHSETFPLVFYVIDQNTALVFESDAARNLVGTLAKQY
jgi:hypothetical protein